MDRTYHPAHAQRTGGALHHLLQPGGCGNHPIHRLRPSHHSASDVEAAEADASHEFPATQAERDSRPLFPGPGPRVAGDHAPVPGGRGEPFRLPGPNDCPDAHPDRPVPGIDSDTFLPAGQPGWIFGEVVHLDPSRPNILSSTDRFALSMAGPRRIRPVKTDTAGARLRVHLGPAEDDDATVDRSAAVGQPSNDALADAVDDCVFLVHTAQRSVSLLDNVQRDWHSYSIFRYRRLGTLVPAVPQIHT